MVFQMSSSVLKSNCVVATGCSMVQFNSDSFFLKLHSMNLLPFLLQTSDYLDILLTGHKFRVSHNSPFPKFSNFFFTKNHRILENTLLIFTGLL